MSQVNIEEADIPTIAKIVFDKPPTIHNQFKIIPENQDNEYVFEVLLTFFMEGVLVRFNNLEGVDIFNLDSNILFNKLDDMGQWFRAVGVNLFIEKIDNTEINRFEYQDKYCKILIANGPDASYFTFRKIDKPYTFLKNSEEYNRQKLHDYFAMLYIDKFAYRISFSKE